VKKYKHLLFPLLVGCIAALFFIPFLGRIHLFDWDEINFAEISREMLVLDQYLRVYVNFEPFWQKPPLFFWLQVISMKLWGINEYAARFPNAICGVVTLVSLFFMGKRLYDQRFGLIWAGTYLGSILPHLYFKTGIIDPWFNLFIFFSLYLFIISYWKDKGFQYVEFPGSSLTLLVLSGFVLGLAILAKGPAAYLIICLCFFSYWLTQRFQFFLKVPEFLLFSLCAAAFTLVWLGLETQQHGPWFALQFTEYQYHLFSQPSAGHKGFPGYHFVVLLLGCFPASIFAFQSMRRFKQQYTYQSNFRKWMLILLGVVVVLFSIVQSKIIHYSSLAYFPLTFLAALTFYRVLVLEITLKIATKIGFLILGGIWVFVPLIATYVGFHPEQAATWLSRDPFASASLEAQAGWTGWEVMPGVWLLGILITVVYLFENNRKSWALNTLLGGTTVFIFLCLVYFPGRIEHYSQRAAIEFCKELQEEDAYVIASGHRSYAPLFYTRKAPPEDFDPHFTPSLGTEPSYNSRKSAKESWLYYQRVDKPVYAISKVQNSNRLKTIETLDEIDRKNGFVFFKRVKGMPCQAWKKQYCPPGTSCNYKYRYFSDFESNDEPDCYEQKQISKEDAYSGEYAWKIGPEIPYSYTLRVYLSEVRGSHTFRMQAHILSQNLEGKKWVYTLLNKQGESIHWEEAPLERITPLKDGWQKIEGTFTHPSDIQEDSILMIYLWNTSQEQILVDDLQIDILGQK